MQLAMCLSGYSRNCSSGGAPCSVRVIVLVVLLAALSLSGACASAASGGLRVTRTLEIQGPHINAVHDYTDYPLVVNDRGDMAFQTDTGSILTISVVDNRGRLVARLSPEGIGGSRFVRPEPVAFRGDSVIVFELGFRRFSVWSRGGELLSELPAPRGVQPVLLAGRFAYGIHRDSRRTGAVMRWEWETGEGLTTIWDHASDPAFAALFADTIFLPASGARDDMVVTANPSSSFSFLITGDPPSQVSFDRPLKHPSPARLERMIARYELRAQVPLPYDAVRWGSEYMRSQYERSQLPLFSSLSPLHLDSDGSIWTVAIADDSAEVILIAQKPWRISTAAVGCPGFNGRWSMSGNWLAVMCAGPAGSQEPRAVVQLYRVSYPNK